MAGRSSQGGAPSLLDPKATGGIYAGDGFTVQERYLALRIPELLADATFISLQHERAEDVDVWFSDGRRDHHQCKNENVTPGEVADLVGTFRARFADLLRECRLRRFVIAASAIGTTLRPFLKSLAIYRSRNFEAGDESERRATLETLRAAAATISLDGHFDFIVEHVHFDTTLSSLDGPIIRARQELAFGMAQAVGIKSIDEAFAIADAVLKAIHEERTRPWKRDELMGLIANARETFRVGPSPSSAELVAIRHETLKHVDEPPSKDTLPLLFGERRVTTVRVDDVATLDSRDAASMSAAAVALASSDGIYCTSISRPNARTLYYGFPHVPFGILAGCVAGQERQVALVEHDLDSKRFEWRAGAPLIGASAVATPLAADGVARLRVSVSARVLELPCEAVLPRSRLRLDLHVEANKIGRGTVGNETQAREYAARVRDLLDNHIAGHQYASLHVFAAVPVSVAFLLGQVMAHSSVPSVYVYNFETNTMPQYAWRLGVREAMCGDACIEFLGEVSDGPA